MAGMMKIHLTYMLHVVFAILNLSRYKVLRFFLNHRIREDKAMFYLSIMRIFVCLASRLCEATPLMPTSAARRQAQGEQTRA